MKNDLSSFHSYKDRIVFRDISLQIEHIPPAIHITNARCEQCDCLVLGKIKSYYGDTALDNASEAIDVAREFLYRNHKCPVMIGRWDDPAHKYDFLKPTLIDPKEVEEPEIRVEEKS